MQPDDEEEARYAEWLMANAETEICNKDDLIYHMEKRTRFDEFRAQDAVKY